MIAAADALRQAVAFAGPALAALVLAALAAVIAIVGVVAVLARGALLMVAASASGLVRLAIAGALVAVVVWAWPVAWRTFGGDVAAMLPASMMVVLPVAWMLAKRAGWPGLLAAIITIAVLAVVLSSVTRPAAHLLLVALLVASVFESVSVRRVHHVRQVEGDARILEAEQRAGNSRS